MWLTLAYPQGYVELGPKGVRKMNKRAVAAVIAAGLAITPVANGATIDAKTKAELIYLIQEEKLARDVYANLTNMGRKFQNINRSESTHMGLVADLIKNYGIKDPTANLKPGVFKDRKLSALYKKIIKTATNSYADALAAGILIEETDIADLKKLMANTQNQDVLDVANRLLSGSQNHLQAFRIQ